MKFYRAFTLIATIISAISCRGGAEYICYNDSSKLAGATYSSSGTFHVCANTTWNTGYWSNAANNYIDGDAPMALGLSGTKILCGPDGDVKNNCTLVGGEVGAEVYNAIGQPANMTDLLIQGFTFTGGKYNDTFKKYTTSIIVWREKVASVELTVKNCHFVNNFELKKNIFVQSQPDIALTPHGEKLIVEDCLFENNTVADLNTAAGSLISGLNSPRIDIVRTKFKNNKDQIPNRPSYLIEGISQIVDNNNFVYSTAQVNVEDSCFIENENVRSLVAQANFKESTFTSNYVVGNKPSDACNGVEYYNNTDFIKNPKICKDKGFKASRCTAASEAPSSMPSSKPSSKPSLSSMPSSMPSSKPSSKPSLSSMPSSNPSSKPIGKSSISRRNKYTTAAALSFLVSTYFCLV